MKTISFSAILLFIAFTFNSCYRDLIGIEGTGSTVTETRSPGNFDGVDLSIDADVILHDSAVCFIRLSGQSNVLNVLTTEIRNNKVCIGFRRNVTEHNTITIHLYAPHFSSATISGSGNITNSNAVINNNLNCTVSGSGNIDLNNVQASAAEIKISGSGRVSLSGTAQSLSTRTSGSGDIHSFGLLVQTGDVTVSGSGKVEINASQQLDVDISGSGDVYYKNNPALNVHISGSGQVYHVN